MPEVTCSRCFAVFDDAAGRRSASAPLCPRCDALAAKPRPQPSRAAPRTGPSRRRRARVVWALAVPLLLAGGAAAALFLRKEEASPAPPSAVELRVEEWRAAGLLPALPPDAALAAARLDEGSAALAADLPSRTAEALRAFREALALSHAQRAAAVAGYATAFADGAGAQPDGAELRATHEMVSEALAGARGRPDLTAAFARLLLLVPSPANDRDALDAAARAVAAAPADPSARLALGLAQLRRDPRAAARTLADAAEATPADRRLLSAAAVAAWAAGDPAAALALADRRLALDPSHAGALALKAEVLAACGRLDEARSAIARWEAAAPRSPLPPLALARIAYQRDGDLAAARRLLSEALGRGPDDFVAARILAHRAAVERAAGDAPAAEAAVAEALRRVPADAPARFQAALLAFRRGDAAGLRESAGVLGERGGAVQALLVAARSAELSGTDEEAQQAYLALADAAPRDPGTLLAAAGALARLRASGPALQIARRALQRDPEEARLRRSPTDFWEGPGPLVEAAMRLAAIGRIESRGGSAAHAAAAECELLLGRTVAAEQLARSSAAAAPEATAPTVLLAQIALDRGNARAALALASDAAEARPGDAPALELRARALEALGRNLDAERAHREAAEAGPDLLTPRLALARILARRGEAVEARGLVDAVLRDEPSLGGARAVLLEVERDAAGAPR